MIVVMTVCYTRKNVLEVPPEASLE